MTKKQIAVLVESLVERLAVAHGAEVGDRPMTVGGRPTTVRNAEGGLLDLDGARRLLGRRLEAMTEELTAPIAG